MGLWSVIISDTLEACEEASYYTFGLKVIDEQSRCDKGLIQFLCYDDTSDNFIGISWFEPGDMLVESELFIMLSDMQRQC